MPVTVALQCHGDSEALEKLPAKDIIDRAQSERRRPGPSLPVVPTGMRIFVPAGQSPDRDTNLDDDEHGSLSSV